MGILVTLGVALVLGVLVWQGLRAWWLHGYSRGDRTGVVRKFSYMGSPQCKFWSGELVMPSTSMARPEVWYFTISPQGEGDPLIKDIQAAEASGKLTTLKYRQDKGKWWACAPTEYYVTAVVKP